MYEFNWEAMNKLKEKFPKTAYNRWFAIWYDYDAIKIKVAFLYNPDPRSDDADIRAVYKIHWIDCRLFNYPNDEETTSAMYLIGETYDDESAKYFKSKLVSTIENAILLFMKWIYEAPECNKIIYVRQEPKALEDKRILALEKK